jgi:hypothetical protein
MLPFVALRKFVERLTKPVEEIDRESIDAYRGTCTATRASGAAARTRARIAGEVRSVRIVPRAGAPSLEVSVYDGSGVVVGVFLGRRRIRGITPGRRLQIEGMLVQDTRRLMMLNPIYELN